MDKIMWVEKYRPKSIAEVVGNEDAKDSFIDWLKKKDREHAVFLYGPAGIGKTALVLAAAREFKYNVVEMNASDIRTRKAILKMAGPVVSVLSLDEFSLNPKGNLLLFDEVDGIFGQQDRGGVGAIVKTIQESQIPIALTANYNEIQKLRPLKKFSRLIRFRRVRIPLIVAYLKRICQAENIHAEKEALEVIAQKSQGDVRSAINDLQTFCERRKVLRKNDVQYIPVRNRGLDIHDTLRGTFSANSSAEAMKSLNNSLIDYDTLLLSIHDNLPLHYKDPEKLAAAYDLLSRADVFRGRIGNVEWSLLKYVFGFLAQSTTVAPGEFRPFRFVFPPTMRSMLMWTKAERTLLETICARIGGKCHVSRRNANLEFLPFLNIILRTESDQASRIAGWLGIDKASINYLKKID